MRTAISLIVASALLGARANGQSIKGMLPLGRAPARVIVNSQKSLADVVGDGFRDLAWEYPAGILPREHLGLTYVSGPGDQGLGMGSWRKSIILKDKITGVELSVNCYRRRETTAADYGGVQPCIALAEPDYQYKPAAFHRLQAAAATAEEREVFVFRDGDHLIKVEATGGKVEARRELTADLAEAIWKFRHPD